MGWWLWPQADGLIKADCSLPQYLDLAADTRGMTVTSHAQEALAERAFGFPVMATFFHAAFGWGVALALRLTVPAFGLDGGSPQPAAREAVSSATAVRLCKRFAGGATNARSPAVVCSFPGSPRTSGISMYTISTMTLSVLLGPALGMCWDPPVRWCFSVLGASKSASVPCLMALMLGLPLILGQQTGTSAVLPKYKSSSSSRSTDWLLFLGALCNHGFFISHALLRRGADILPGDLKVMLVTIAIVALTANARAAGVIGDGKK